MPDDADNGRRFWPAFAMGAAAAVCVAGVAVAVWVSTRPAPPRVISMEATGAGQFRVDGQACDADAMVEKVKQAVEHSADAYVALKLSDGMDEAVAAERVMALIQQAGVESDHIVMSIDEVARHMRDEVELSVALPSAADARQLQALSAGEPLVINITKDGTAVVHGKPRQPNELRDMLRELARQQPGQSVLLRADAESAHKHVALIMQMCRKAGVENVSVGYLVGGDVNP